MVEKIRFLCNYRIEFDALARFPPGTLIEVSVKDKKSGYIHTHHGFVRNGNVYEERYEKTKAAIIEGMHYLLEANEKMGNQDGGCFFGLIFFFGFS